MFRLIERFPKVLSTEVKDLELNGFIRRNIFMGKSVVVEYELMEYADTVRDVLQALSEWRTLHRENIRNCMKKKESAEVS